ncbi:TPM domain-containing protein [Paenibacillus sp. NFR01]|uniref:TPM domain-containing protein n=1 Tax=Paenibacillus sp. NFR01 TaxID=1566279 RepID=UPI0008C1BDA6|nr:TPM domain-containing protein [Paenibacillus sp. NFR01]SEU23878.1 Septation ring formation regulator, EzrA [Paenibacillus sp. NFR01]
MKKVMSILLFLCLLWTSAVSAAGLPAPSGPVTDQAGMLSAQEAADIGAKAAGERYTFHVLTIPSLDGADSAAYATEVYQAWKLATRDVLVLLSAEDRQVELNFNNPGLQSALDDWSASRGGRTGSGAITELLDTYFIPYAKDGDYAGGIYALMAGVNALGTASPAGGGTAGGSASGAVTGGAGTGGVNTGGAGANGSAHSGEGAAGGSGAGGQSAVPDSGALPGSTAAPDAGSGMGRAVLIGAAVLLLGALLAFALTGLQRRKRLGARHAALAELLVQANRAGESLQPFQGVVQGKTAEMVDGIAKRLSAQLVAISAMQADSPSALPFYRLGALKAAIAKLEEAEQAFRASLAEEEQRIAQVSDADRHVKERITELKAETPELEDGLRQAVKESGYALGEIAEDLEELAGETAEADRLELFDPLAAQQIAEEAQERQERIERDLKDVDIYDDKLAQFPAALEAARVQISGIIGQNQLQNMKIKPYDSLAAARQKAETAQAPLQNGDMDQVRAIFAEADGLRNEAIAATQRQAEIRQSNRKDLEQVRRRLEQLTARQRDLTGQTAAAARRFAARFTQATSEQLVQAGMQLEQQERDIRQIADWTEDARGEYDKAREALDALLNAQEQTEQTLERASSTLGVLEQRLAAVQTLLVQGQEAADEAQSLLRRNGLSGGGRFDPLRLQEYGILRSGLQQQPIDLDELEAAGRSYMGQISVFAEEARRLVRQKLQREERERRQRMSSGPPPFGGPGGHHSGGGNSSGGSSWGGSGGGGHSSGGSSWGGGKSGGNSSGGSKW